MKKSFSKFLLSAFSVIAFQTPQVLYAQNDLFDKCNKLKDAIEFRDCMSGGAKKNKTLNSDLYQQALINFEEGDSLRAIKSVNSFIKKNPNSKEGYLLRAFINTYDLSDFDKALDDIDKSLDIDNNYALAYALKSDVFYFDIGGSASQTKKMLKKAYELSPENPFVNFVKGDFYYDNSFVLLDKDKLDLAIKSAEEALIYFEKVVVNSQDNEDLILKRIYPLGIGYTATALLGDTKFELFFMYKNNKDRKTAKKYLEDALSHYTKAISMSPSQEKAEEIELDRDFDLRTPADVYRARGNVYSWMNNKLKNACSDWKVAKKYGDKDAQKNYREFKC